MQQKPYNTDRASEITSIISSRVHYNFAKYIFCILCRVLWKFPSRKHCSTCPQQSKSLMAEWLEQASQWHEMCCHDLEVMSSNPSRVELGELGVHGTSVVSHTLITLTARPGCWSGLISDSYYSLKPLWSRMGEVVPARTSPTLHPPSPPTVLLLPCLKVSQCINSRD